MFQFERTRHGVAGIAASESERRHADAIKFGTVHEADYTKARLKVLIGDETDPEGHLITGWLPMPGARAGNDADWHALEVGERVAVLSEGGDLPNGVVIPAGLYNSDFPAPGNKAGMWIRKFKDGGQITYDRDSGEWLLEGMKKATVKVGTSTVVTDPQTVTVTVGGATLTIKDGEITLSAGGNSLKLDGSGVTVSGGSITHDGKNVGKDHKHTQVQAGTAVSGPPQ